MSIGRLMERGMLEDSITLLLTLEASGDMVGADDLSIRATALSYNGLRLHPSIRLVEVDGSSVELTRTEFDMLAALRQRSRRVISKDELVEHTRSDLSGYAVEADRRTIESHMANVRRKLSDSPSRPRFIETVRGVGSLARQAGSAAVIDGSNLVDKACCPS